MIKIIGFAKTFSPVKLGEEEVSTLEYLIEGNNVYVYEFRNILPVVQEYGIDRFIETIKNSKDVKLKDIVGGSREKLGGSWLRIPIKSQIKYRSLKLLPRYHGGKVLIPGSSIKGAVRTAYLYWSLKKNIGEGMRKLGKSVEDYITEEDLKLNSVFKNVAVRDVYLDPGVQVIVKRVGDFRDFPLGVVNKGTDFKIEFIFKDDKLVGDVREAIDLFYSDLINYKLKLESNPEVRRFYESLLKGMKKYGFSFMQLGFGGGYYSKSVNLLFGGPKRKVKGRGILVDLEGKIYPLGWVGVKWVKQ